MKFLGDASLDGLEHAMGERPVVAWNYGGRCVAAVVLVLACVQVVSAILTDDSSVPVVKEPFVGRVAAVFTADERWEFSCRPNEDDLRVRVVSRRQSMEFALSFGGTLGHVEDIVAAGREVNGELMIALGVVCRSRGNGPLEYRLLVGGHTGSDIHSEAGWVYSAPLLIRSRDKPFDAMSVAVFDGDSVMLSLHEVVRGTERTDQIRVHVFVNHCPVGARGRAFDALNTHYEAVLRRSDEQS